MNKRIRVGIIIGAIAIIVTDFTFLDYGNLTWSKNMSPFLGIIAMTFLIASMIIQIREDKKQKANLNDNNS